MCRLYGFRATELTKIECTLLHAQNALIVQSWKDRSGTSHLHGWGLAAYQNQRLHIERQAQAAIEAEGFRRAASRAYSNTVLAHVRRATVGRIALENTHPFCHGPWAFVHNGTLPNFDSLRPRMIEMMTPEHRAAIRGETDSEHVFHLILSMNDAMPDRPLVETLSLSLGQIVAWCHEIDPAARIGLNVLLTDGDRLVGSRWGRTLHYVERWGVHDCEICGFPHIRHDPRHSYRAVVIASEPISDESWREIPDSCVFAVTTRMALEIYFRWGAASQPVVVEGAPSTG
ncbi:MAG: class II glutamine amidotransferase [Rhodoplanes sp.]